MIHPITPTLYQTICEWWKEYEWPAIPQEMLPSRGYVAFADEKPICVSFLYKDETSSVGLMDWLTFNPEANSEERTKVFKELMDHIQKVSKEIGIKKIMTFARHPRLEQRLSEHQFFLTDQNVNLLIKEV